MFKIESLPQTIDIGFTGEKVFRKVEVDMSAWEEDMPDGVPAAIHQLPGGTAYRPTVTFADHVLTWVIRSTDLGSGEGTGELQFEMKNENAAVKSKIVRTVIHQAIMR